MSQAARVRRQGRRGAISRLFIVLTSAVMTVSPTGASLLAADEPAPPSTGTVDGTVWVDTDGDGILGDNEEGLAGITMLLRSDAGTVTSAESGEDG